MPGNESRETVDRDLVMEDVGQGPARRVTADRSSTAGNPGRGGRGRAVYSPSRKSHAEPGCYDTIPGHRPLNAQPLADVRASAQQSPPVDPLRSAGSQTIESVVAPTRNDQRCRESSSALTR